MVITMSVQNASILAGATITPSGGSAVSYTPNGQTIQNGIQLIDAAVTDYRIRPTLTLKVKNPVLDSQLVYSKDRKSILLVEPILLASGKVVFNLIRIEREVHPETTAANTLGLNTKGAQLLTDADFTNFWAAGSTA